VYLGEVDEVDITEELDNIGRFLVREVTDPLEEQQPEGRTPSSPFGSTTELLPSALPTLAAAASQ
jgi:hypothetical protein